LRENVFTFIRPIPGTAAKNATVGAVYFLISGSDVNNILSKISRDVATGGVGS
jgi:hypothetical protein